MKIVLTGLGKLEESRDETDTPFVPKGYKKTRVLCCAVCRTDAKMWEQGHRDLILPRVLGHEMVVADDRNQRYIVWPGKSCNTCRFCSAGKQNLCEKMEITGFHTDGGFADLAVLPENSLIPIPADTDIHSACFAEPVACVVNAFEKLETRKKDKVLIYGSGTMGLIAALYARSLGLTPVLLEKSESKIDHITPFLKKTGLSCVKDTTQAEFDLVINACADYIAFCQAVTKVEKGGQLSFFSGISKNEHIETNLLNLIHYKEIRVTGVYGMTKDHMVKGLPFIKTHTRELKLLIEAISAPQQLPKLIGNVLSGKHLKYILDFSLKDTLNRTEIKKQPPSPKIDLSHLPSESLVRHTVELIHALPETLLASATAKMDDKTKPLGALGRLEPLAVKMACIQNSLTPAVRQKNLFVFAADHGITEEGVSAYPSEVTAQMVDNFLNGGAAINVLCGHYGIDMKIVDMGVNHRFSSHPRLIIQKTAPGTRNFAIEAAMTEKQMIQALENGMTVFLDAFEKRPIDIVGLGEMGIGNSTSAAAIISAVTGIEPSRAVGRGTGVDDKGLSHKTQVIERALNFHHPDASNGFDILQKIGGYEIAGIAGAALAAASKKCAVVLDGVISTAAGLIAFLIQPDIQGYLISGHKSVEIGQAAALSHMGLEPLIDLDMRLGEGTGAAMAIDMTDAACKTMCDMASFDEAKVARSF